MTNKPFVIPQCPTCNIEMELNTSNEKILSFVCPTEDCQEMTDMLKMYIDRDDPILKKIPTYKKMGY